MCAAHEQGRIARGAHGGQSYAHDLEKEDGGEEVRWRREGERGGVGSGGVLCALTSKGALREAHTVDKAAHTTCRGAEGEAMIVRRRREEGKGGRGEGGVGLGISHAPLTSKGALREAQTVDKATHMTYEDGGRD